MRTDRVITALVVLNLALIAAAGYLWFLYIKAKNERRIEIQTKYVTNVVRRVVVRNPENYDTNPPVLFRRWRDLESTDYRIFIRNLRAFGCPEDVIQDIIVADVGRLYDEKRKEILAKNPPKYWKGYDKKVFNEFKRLADEQKSLIMELLNISYDSFLAKINIPDSPKNPEVYLDFLPDEKRQKVEQIISQAAANFSKSKMYVPNFAKSGWLAGVPMFLLEDDLKDILTPDEYKEFLIRNSQVAQDLREELEDIEVSENEYRQLYEVMEYFAENVLSIPEYSESGEPLLAKFHQDHYSKLKQILGEKRFADYIKYNDWDYKYISEFSKTYELPKETTEKVYEFKKAFISEIRRIENDPSLTSQQRSNIAIALIQESERTLKGLLGETIYNEYKDYDSDYVNLCNNLLMENVSTNAQPQPQNTNEVITIPMPPWGPYPPPPPPLLKR